MLILCPLVGHLPNYGGYKYLNASVLVFYSLFCLVGVFKKQWKKKYFELILLNKGLVQNYCYL